LKCRTGISRVDQKQRAPSVALLKHRVAGTHHLPRPPPFFPTTFCTLTITQFVRQPRCASREGLASIPASVSYAPQVAFTLPLTAQSATNCSLAVLHAIDQVPLRMARRGCWERSGHNGTPSLHDRAAVGLQSRIHNQHSPSPLL